jgi:hypothetical protein
MPESGATLEITNNLKPAQNADDIHLKAVPFSNIELIGVDGVGPNTPTTSYDYEGSGTGSISISKINVAPGTVLKVRLKSNSIKFPKIEVQWTVKGKAKGESFQVNFENDEDEESDEPISFPEDSLDRFERLIDKFSELINQWIQNNSKSNRVSRQR